MGAMKNWAMVCEELHAARTHWEQCNHAAMAALRAELEAFDRLTRAREEHQREIRAWIASQNAREGVKDAPGTPTRTAGGPDAEDRSGCDCEETCAECGKAVSEDEYADTPRGEPVLHDDCCGAYAAWRREQEAAWRADEMRERNLEGTHNA